MGIDGLDFARSLSALALVLGLIFLAGWAARRWLPSLRQAGGTRRLQLIEQLPLDTRSRLALVRIDDREHAVVLSAHGVCILPPDSAVRTGVATHEQARQGEQPS